MKLRKSSTRALPYMHNLSYTNESLIIKQMENMIQKSLPFSLTPICRQSRVIIPVVIGSNSRLMATVD